MRAQTSRPKEHVSTLSGPLPFSAFMQQITVCSLGYELSSSRYLSWLSAWSPAVLICRSCTAQQETVLSVPITALEEKEYRDTLAWKAIEALLHCQSPSFKDFRLYKRKPPQAKRQDEKNQKQKPCLKTDSSVVSLGFFTHYSEIHVRIKKKCLLTDCWLFFQISDWYQFTVQRFREILC